MPFVYFVKNESRDVVKIGFARDPWKRLGFLQTGSVDPLQLLGAMPGEETDEKLLHDKFARYRRRGEWFDLTGELKDFVSQIPPCPRPDRVPPPPLEIDMEAALHPDMVRRALVEGMSKAAISRQAGLHANTLADVESEEWSPRWKTLQRFCAAIDAIRAERA